ncbi:hypothetical protein C4573_03795 [Candidatus Woesearchaeota archaeon]|nr:MAG: hypothetical protein C4573_03795 [Candidatus Woesearchaeota archaeon]
MALVFKYKPIKRQHILKKAPFIPVFIESTQGTLYEFMGLIDSGADNTVIPYDLAVLLGLDLGEEKLTRGIGGSAKARTSSCLFSFKNDWESLICQCWFCLKRFLFCLEETVFLTSSI